MIGPMRPGMYRITQKRKGKIEVLFFRVKRNLNIVQLQHIDGRQVTIKGSKEPLTAKMWRKLEFWQ